MPTPFPSSANLQTGHQSGLTLIEMMVAMVIGLFLIGGVISVFVANQQTSNAKQQLDRAQENFRFGSQTLMRVMRQGSGIDPASTSAELIVEFSGGPGTHDCVGTPAGGPNRFRVDDQSRLVCTDSGGVDHVLMGDMAALNVFFGLDANDNGLIENNEYVAHSDVTNWARVASVRAALTLTSGQQLPFTATMRPVIVTAHSAPTPLEDPDAADGGSDAETGDDSDGNTDGSEGTNEGNEGSEGTSSSDTDGDTDAASMCKCYYRNAGHGYSLEDGSPLQCTKSCCQANDHGTGNDRHFDVNVSSC